MNYKELLERYKNGLASEEEKKRIEEDIEKYEAIEEYLSDSMDMDLIHLTTPRNSENHNDETIKIKKSVNSRLRKVVFTSVAIAMALLIGIFFVISPLVDSFYYNPSKITIGKNMKDINFDIYALTELNMPGYSLTSDVYVDRKGFGEYDINYFRRNLFTQEMNYVTSKIKRGGKSQNHTEIVEDIGFYFTDIIHPIGTPKEATEHKERVMNHISRLNPVSYLSASLTFERDLTMEELHRLEEKYPDINFVWAGIRTAPQDKMNPTLIGINLINGHNVLTGQDIAVEEKYPAFAILDWLVNPKGYDSDGNSLKAMAYELHYKSLLKYMVDRNEAIKVLGFHPGRPDYYKSALDYAEENGVKTFGVLVYADAEDLIELVENEGIKLVELNQVLASRGYIR